MNALRRTGALLFAVCLSVSFCALPGLAMTPSPPPEGNAPLPEVTADSETDKPTDGDEIPLIPLVPSTPTEPEPPDESIPEPVVITVINDWYPFTDGWAGLPGSSLEVIESYFSDLGLKCFAADGERFGAGITWDFSAVDTDTVGLYYATGTLTPPRDDENPLREIVFAEGLALPVPTVPISIQAEGKPEINCFFTGRGIFRFPWVSPPGDLSKITVWLSENEGEWIEIKEPNFHVQSFKFDLRNSVLTLGNNYRLQVDYDGGQTGILSFAYDDTIKINNYSEGDRDGGDAGGSKPGSGDTEQKPPQPDEDDGGGGYGSGNTNGNGGEMGDNRPEETAPPSATPSPAITPQPTQPEETQEPSPTPSAETQAPAETPEPIPTATEPAQPELPAVPDTAPPTPPRTSPPRQEPGETVPAQPTPSAEDFMEVTGETRDLISGTRLRLMMESAGQAQFSKQGVTVTFTAQAVKGLSFRDSDRIAVTIEKEGENCVTFSLTVNDLPVTQVPGTTLMVPYAVQTPGATFSLLDEGEKAVDIGSYDEALAVASFTVDTTGRFTIVEESGEVRAMAPVQAPEQPHVPIWPALLLAVAIVVGVGGGLLLKRRAGR